MTGLSKSDNDRDVISLSTAERSRHSDLLDALEKALEATKPLAQMSALAPLQPTQEPVEPPDADGVQPDKPAHNGSAFDHEPAKATRDDVVSLRFTEPVGSQRSNGEWAKSHWPPPDHGVAARSSSERARADLRRVEPARDNHRKSEVLGTEFEPFGRRPRRPVNGPIGPDEQRMRHQFIEMLRERQQAEALELIQPRRNAKQPVIGMIGRLAIAGAVAFASSYLLFKYITVNPQSQGASRSAVVDAAPPPRTSGASEGQRPAAPAARRLTLTALSGVANKPIALGIKVETAPPGAFILIRGLARGSRITAGAGASEGVWQVPVRDLSRAAVMPPEGFVGAMNLSVDLSLSDGTVIDSDVLKIEWTPAKSDPIAPTPVQTTTIMASRSPQPEAATSLPTVPEADQAAVAGPESAGPGGAGATRKLDPEELETLLTRADKYLEDRDIAAARLLLRRAAEAGEVRAAIALAATYDPAILSRLGVLGARADVERARAWYQKAAELGSAEAKQRLQRLSQHSR